MTRKWVVGYFTAEAAEIESRVSSHESSAFASHYVRGLRRDKRVWGPFFSLGSRVVSLFFSLESGVVGLGSFGLKTHDPRLVTQKGPRPMTEDS